MTTMIPTKCDCCGAEAEELTQVPHMSGVMDGGVYRCAWLCGACAGDDEPHVHAIEHSRAWTNGDVLGRCACGVECLNGVWKEED